MTINKVRKRRPQQPSSIKALRDITLSLFVLVQWLTYHKSTQQIRSVRNRTSEIKFKSGIASEMSNVTNGIIIVHQIEHVLICNVFFILTSISPNAFWRATGVYSTGCHVSVCLSVRLSVTNVLWLNGAK